MSKNYVCSIDYKGKGYFSGKSHSFKATISPAPGTGGASGSHVIEGTWHTTSKFTSGSKSGSEFHNVTGPKEEVTAVGGEPSGEMSDFETRKLWTLVAKGIREGDFDLASREKSKIEVNYSPPTPSSFTNLASQNEQRQRRKDEIAAGTTWQLKHFIHEASDPACKLRLNSVSHPSYSAFLDERLGKLGKLNPTIEDMYVFKENWPQSGA